jgi:hypothetical protein
MSLQEKRIAYRCSEPQSSAAGIAIIGVVPTLIATEGGPGWVGRRAASRRAPSPRSGTRQFLGHRLGRDGSLGLAPKSIARAKDRLRRIAHRNRGIILERMISEGGRLYHRLGDVLRHIPSPRTLRDPDGWLRRKAASCAVCGSSRANAPSQSPFFRGPEWSAWILALSGKRVVAHGRKPLGPRSHVHDLVRFARTGDSCQPSCRVERCQNPPDTISTSGGVRGETTRNPPTRFVA